MNLYNFIAIVIILITTSENLTAQQIDWVNRFSVSNHITDGITCQKFSFIPNINTIVMTGNYIGNSAYLASSSANSANINLPGSDLDGFISFTNPNDGSIYPPITYAAGGYIVDTIEYYMSDIENSIYVSGRYNNTLSISAPFTSSFSNLGDHAFIHKLSNNNINLTTLELSSCVSGFCGLWIKNISPIDGNHIIVGGDYIGNIQIHNATNLNSNNYNNNSIIGKINSNNGQWLWWQNIELTSGDISFVKLIVDINDNSTIALFNVTPIVYGISPYSATLPNFDNYSKDILLIKFDSQGNAIQSKVFNLPADEIGYDLVQDDSGFIYISGTEDIIGINSVGFIKKLDPLTLNEIWSYSQSYPLSENDIMSINYNSILNELNFLGSRLDYTSVNLVRGRLNSIDGSILSENLIALPINQNLFPNKPINITLFKSNTSEFWGFNYDGIENRNSCFLVKVS